MSLTESKLSLLRDAFEDAPFEFWARDLDGTRVVANAATRRLGVVLGDKVGDAPVPNNAAKFTPPGGTITVSLTADAERVRLEISDTGLGIDREALLATLPARGAAG